MIKYRHAYHAGNFADVHKHVTLAALIEALERKDKGFQYLETHAGRGAYDLESAPAAHARTAAIERVLAAAPSHPELAAYARVLGELRARAGNPHAYPGSPLVAAGLLRPQDRAVLIEALATEAESLRSALPRPLRAQVVQADGFERLRAFLPPPERRGLTFIDPPYEETREDFARAERAVREALQRFQTGVIAQWYPIKDARDIEPWLAGLRARLTPEILVGELWLHPRDSRVALNGSGMLILNPPYGLAERMHLWLPALHGLLDPQRVGGASVRLL
ncbi:MAG TPA: 23S rRNA (adenine(2030)-N(6))-methyltransferase RlmJ [Steroidobacteraceae bacterium]|nr:23S rRNA (adenine(2030)-N(6))-methyltransferase RlmJ [Steroidobacteraceae bacterium]